MDEDLRILEREASLGDKDAQRRLDALKRRARIKTVRNSGEDGMVTDLIGCRVEIDHEEDVDYYPGFMGAESQTHRRPYAHHNMTGIIRSLSEKKSKYGGLRVVIELDETHKLITPEIQWLKCI